jgi:hypothetical protein
MFESLKYNINAFICGTSQNDTIYLKYFTEINFYKKNKNLLF